MFVFDWMTKKVITAKPEDSISFAEKIMKENNIKHLPILDKDKLVGIVSDRDIKAFMPSSSSTLDVYELKYLLDKSKLKDIMKKNIITVLPNLPIEECAVLMFEKNIGAFPVLDKDKLVGIISDKDIFKVLIDITGVKRGGYRIALDIDDKPGIVRSITKIIRDNGFSVQSILSSYENIEEGKRKLVIRLKKKWIGDFNKLKNDLNNQFKGIIIQ